MASWLRRILGGAGAAGEIEFPRPPGDNPIRDLLTEAGVPWLWPRARLARHYGVRPHPAHSSDIIQIDGSQSFVDGLLWPLSTQVQPQFSPRMPALEFSSSASIGDDARENLRHVLEQLEPKLGAPTAEDNANSLGRRWRCGGAMLRIVVWPPELQKFPTVNPSHDREPWLKTACYLQTRTGYRLTASPAEIMQIESFAAVADIPGVQRDVADPPLGLGVSEYDIEYVREPAGDMSRLSGRIGCSADRATLIYCAGTLVLVPMADVIEFNVHRRTPGRGQGGSSAYLRCRTDFRCVATKDLHIASSRGADDLNQFAATLAAIGKPVNMGDYCPDE
jgi:hypothetical protein